MFLADLHIHSRYSRATSKTCAPETLDHAARQKGLHLIGTGDFTHPAWRQELAEKLIPAEEGFYRLKDELALPCEVSLQGSAPRFVLSSEISCIYKKNGRTRKVHLLILLPSLEKAEALSKKLETIGNLHSDGRPILGLDSKDLLELTLETCPDAIFIPAHIWTPHFSLFGAYSGFDTIEECFEDLTPQIHALETGLSSDPPMNWRLEALDRYTLVSNSDAHSPANLAREANLFHTDFSYPAISHALAHPETQEFYGTLEFFPEEGKYHYDGHRNCGVCLSPEQTIALGGICPVCGKRLTVGVSHRVEELATQPLGRRAPYAKHFESITPLAQALASCLGHSNSSLKIRNLQDVLAKEIGPELYILREAPLDQIKEKAGPLVAEGIRRLRAGEVLAQPGFDGAYGKIQLIGEEERACLQGQLSFFESAPSRPSQKSTAFSPSAAPAPAAKAEQPTFAEPSDHYGLNQLQWEAASCPAPVIAVQAGPGTGKTRTLVCRIASLLEHSGIPASQITAVTFTNQAALEMRDRLAHELGRSQIRALSIGTFHSICLALLKKCKLSCPVLEENEALLLAKEVIKSFSLHFSANGLLRRISGIKNQSLPASELPDGVMAAYDRLLECYGVMDYDDILLKTIAELESGKRERSLGCFTHLLVDEFQDINPLQYRLIQLWKRENGSLFCIGDPNQSIYGFRGASAECFSRLASDYPQCKQITLQENYRSTPEILGCAQPVVQSSALEPRQPSGSKVQLVKTSSARSEGIYVAHEIIQMMGGIDMLGAHGSKKRSHAQNASLSFSDIALLYRTHRQAAQLEYCLQKEGIPYIVLGREDYLSDAEVQRALAFFRLLCAPQNLLALSSSLLAAGCSHEQAGQIRQCYQDSGYHLASLAQTLLLQTENTPALLQFSQLLEHFLPLFSKTAPQALLEDWAKQLDITENASFERLLCAASAHKDLPSFLANIALGQEADIRRSGSRTYPLDAVTLSTLHGAKGLEFEAVFLCGLNQGILPLQNVGNSDLGEERRLLYVGMTRAKSSLHLSYYAEPSPLLSELPAAFFEADTAADRKKILAKQLSLFDV